MDTTLDVKGDEISSVESTASFAEACEHLTKDIIHTIVQCGSTGKYLVKNPGQIPSFTKDEIRIRGRSYAGGIEFLAAIGVTLSTATVASNNLTLPYEILNITAILWLASHCVDMIPIPAIKNDVLNAAEDLTKNKHENLLKKIRKVQIKSHALLDAAGSGLYAISGVLLQNPLMPASVIWYLVSDKIHFSGVQGEDVPLPFLKKEASWSERLKEYKTFASDLVKSNPNLKAEMIAYPGILISLAGLSFVLPKWQIPVFLAAYTLASISRGSSIAIQDEALPTSVRPPMLSHAKERANQLISHFKPKR